MQNPLFCERQRMRASTWNIPRFLHSYDETLDGGLILPRGLLDTVTSLAAQGAKMLGDLLQVPGAGRRQADGARAMFEQRHAKPRFEGLDLVAHGARSHVQLSRCLPDALQSARRFEEAERVERGQTPGRLRPFHKFSFVTSVNKCQCTTVVQS